MTTDTKDTVAATAFAGFMALALGPVGLLLAALAVGMERAWTNGVGGGSAGSAAREGWRNSVADHRAWLDWDRGHRAGQRAVRRQWLAAGGDPATEPARAARSARFGGWLHRLWARTAVIAAEFGTGFGAGWQAAKRVKDGGGSFGDIVRSRPGPDVLPGLDDPVTGEDDGPRRRREHLDLDPPRETPDRRAPGGPEEPPVDWGEDASTTPERPATSEGETVTAPVNTQGETHADLTIVKLDAISMAIGQAEEANDRSAAIAADIESLTLDAGEYAAAKGATAATRVAVDEARALAASIRAAVAQLADLCAQAAESVNAAAAGMRPAIDAQDALNTAGARGDIVATATSD